MLSLKPLALLALAPLAIQTADCGDPTPTTGVAVGDVAVMIEACGFCHDAGGVATIVDEDTLRIDDFTYDGNAPDAYIYLGMGEDTFKTDGIRLSAKLDRPYAGESLTFDLPAGVTLADFDTIAVFCYRYDEVFASGTFAP